MPTEVKNRTIVYIADEVLPKIQNIVTNGRRNQVQRISYFELIVNLETRLENNFRVTQEGILEQLISGTNRWERAMYGGRIVRVRRAYIGRISID